MSEAATSHESSTGPALYSLIFLAGMSFSILGSTLPEIATALSLDKTGASAFPLAQFSGDFLGLLILGFALKKPRRLLLVCAALFIVSALAIGIFADRPFTLKAAFFAFGIASGISISLPGMIVSRIAKGRAAREMNLFFAFFSAGVMVAPLCCGGLAWGGFGFQYAFFGFAGLSVVAALVMLALPPPEPELGEGLRPAAVSELLRDHRGVLAGVVLMNLCYVGAEAVPNAWIPKYLHDTFPGGAEFRATLVLSLFWATMTGGRFVCAALIDRGISPRGLLAALAVLSSACLLAAPAMESRLAAEALFILSGLFFSGMFPLIISYTERLPDKSSGTLFILVMAAGMLGASLAGRSVGIIADSLGFGWGMALAALLSAAILALMPLAERARG